MLASSPPHIGDLSVIESAVTLSPDPAVRRMYLHYSQAFSPSPASGEGPRCRWCGECMGLVRIPGLAALEIGTFACAGCHQGSAAAIERDPMTATVVWLDSHDLRPPT